MRNSLEARANHYADCLEEVFRLLFVIENAPTPEARIDARKRLCLGPLSAASQLAEALADLVDEPHVQSRYAGRKGVRPRFVHRTDRRASYGMTYHDY